MGSFQQGQDTASCDLCLSHRNLRSIQSIHTKHPQHHRSKSALTNALFKYLIRKMISGSMRKELTEYSSWPTKGRTRILSRGNGAGASFSKLPSLKNWWSSLQRGFFPLWRTGVSTGHTWYPFAYVSDIGVRLGSPSKLYQPWNLI